MVQINRDTGKERQIRQPLKWKAPSKPLVPSGPTTVVTVPRGSPGTTVQVPHPRVKGAFISVHVPASAKPGQAMLVPVPQHGLATTEHPSGHKAATSSTPHKTSHATEARSSWTTGGKVAAGAGVAAAAFGGGVAGAVLGDHIAEHGLEATLDAAGDGVADAAEAAEDFAADAGEFTVDAAEDLGDFVMDLF